MGRNKKETGAEASHDKPDRASKPNVLALCKVLQDMVDALKTHYEAQESNKKNKYFERIAFWLKTFKAIVIDLIVIICVFLLILFTYHEVRKKVVLIEPFVVSQELEKQGYTGKVIANKLSDEINIIRNTANTRVGGSENVDKTGRGKSVYKPLSDILPEWSESQVDFEFLGSGMTFNSIIRFIRKFFRDEPPHILGEVIMQKDQIVAITIRVSGNPAKTISGELKAIEKEILSQAAEHIYKYIDPFILASYLYSKNDTNNSIEAIQYVISHKPQEDDSWAYNLWGKMLMEQKNYDGAAEKYNMATKLNPKFALAYNSWGVALKNKKLYIDAIEKYKKAIELDPKFVWSYNNWGYALFEQKKYKEAIEMYQKAIEIEPKFAFAYNNWGYALYEQKEYKEAVEKYQKAIEIDPGFAWPYSNCGNALFELKKYKEAVEKYQKAIEIDPKFTYAYNNCGNALCEQKKYEEAIEKYQTAIEIDPKFILAYISWGDALCELKKYEEAIKNYEKVIKLEPKSALAYFLWGRALKELNDDKGAIEKFKKAMGLDPNGMVEKYCRDEMKQLERSNPK